MKRNPLVISIVRANARRDRIESVKGSYSPKVGIVGNAVRCSSRHSRLEPINNIAPNHVLSRAPESPAADFTPRIQISLQCTVRNRGSVAALTGTRNVFSPDIRTPLDNARLVARSAFWTLRISRGRRGKEPGAPRLIRNGRLWCGFSALPATRCLTAWATLRANWGWPSESFIPAMLCCPSIHGKEFHRRPPQPPIHRHLDRGQRPADSTLGPFPD